MNCALRSWPEETLEKVFVRCASDNFSLANRYRDELSALTSEILFPAEDWDGSMFDSSARMFELPRTLSEYLPANPEIDQWPYNFQYFMMPWISCDSDCHRSISLKPYFRAELELALDEHSIPPRTDARRREAELGFVREVGLLAEKALIVFCDPTESEFAIPERTRWLTYFTDVAGCIDAHGLLDRANTCRNALEREWGKPVRGY